MKMENKTTVSFLLTGFVLAGVAGLLAWTGVPMAVLLVFLPLAAGLLFYLISKLIFFRNI